MAPPALHSTGRHCNRFRRIPCPIVGLRAVGRVESYRYSLLSVIVRRPVPAAAREQHGRRPDQPDLREFVTGFDA